MYLFPVMISAFIILSCAQDPIFYDLSIEPVPKVPIIAGSPTNMAVVNGKIYVGSRNSRRIYFYDGNRWTSMGTPGGTLGQLATDGTSYLYALVYPNGEPTSSSVIKRYDVLGGQWDGVEISVPGYSIQSLFCTDDTVFAGCQVNSDRQSYAIMYCDLDLSSSPLISGTSLLTGVAKGPVITLLATLGGGVLKFDGSSTSLIPQTNTAGKLLRGIIYTGDTVGTYVAVGNDTDGSGSVYQSDTGDDFTVISTGPTFTGALSVWKKYDEGAGIWQPALLLLGIHGQLTSLTHGYREMLLDTTGNVISGIKNPGSGTPTSVTSQAKYDASLGVNPVEAILQVPDISEGGPLDYAGAIAQDPSWQPPMFASTAQNGVWSYRSEQWNAED